MSLNPQIPQPIVDEYVLVEAMAQCKILNMSIDEYVTIAVKEKLERHNE